ncbi:MAG: TetR family transcriptional regulator [Acidimicrobiia bacterium]|nr:TetR family transcriptional regulator [Acidimicrobiia bacterium]
MSRRHHQGGPVATTKTTSTQRDKKASKTSARAERPTDKAQATRRALIGLAAELFANRGYAQTSIRDVARQASMTTGAIYGHFRNKADLLAAAIELRTATDLEGQVFARGPGPVHIQSLRKIATDYQKRRQFRALIVEAAAASHTDPETRDHVRDEQLAHLGSWIAGYEANREELEKIHPSTSTTPSCTRGRSRSVSACSRRSVSSRAPRGRGATSRPASVTPSSWHRRRSGSRGRSVVRRGREITSLSRTTRRHREHSMAPDMQLAGNVDILRSNFIGGVKHMPVTYTPGARKNPAPLS